MTPLIHIYFWLLCQSLRTNVSAWYSTYYQRRKSHLIGSFSIVTQSVTKTLPVFDSKQRGEGRDRKSSYLYGRPANCKAKKVTHFPALSIPLTLQRLFTSNAIHRLTVPFSSRLVSIPIVRTLSCQIIRQKSSNVFGRGPSTAGEIEVSKLTPRSTPCGAVLSMMNVRKKKNWPRHCIVRLLGGKTLQSHRETYISK